jgi:lysophospholipase L1-like esterase
MRIGRGATWIGALAVALSIAPAASADWRSAPILPHLDRKTEAGIARRLEAPGVRADTLAKAGDSISYYPSFLQGFGCGRAELGRWDELRSTVARFRRRTVGGESNVCPRVNSFSRRSVATLSGSVSAWAIESGSLEAELSATRAAWLLVMFGTNDARYARTRAEYLASMNAIVDTALAHHATPILYTVPPRRDDPLLEARVESYNAGLVALARRRHLPLINFWRAMQDRMLTPDGIHLAVWGTEFNGGEVADGSTDRVRAHRAARFTRGALRYGANARNLLTLETLSRVSAVR